MSLAHVRSYITKWKTGQGDTVNPFLHGFAEFGSHGIALRAAENYDNPYKALLDYLGMKGTMTTVEEALPVICRKLSDKAPLANKELFDEIELNLLVGAPVNKGAFAELIITVIFPTIHQRGVRKGKFIKKVEAAEPALEQIAAALKEDESDVLTAQVPRVFHEVRVSPEQLDATVAQFLTECHNWRIL